MTASTTEYVRVLQALRLKGRVEPAPLAAASGLSETDCASIVGELIERGIAEETSGRLKLTAAGRDELARLLTRERAEINQVALMRQYRAFDEHNTALKSLMTCWQLRGEDSPNDHTDAAYDRAVVNDLVTLNAGFQPLLTQLVQTAPRLAHYPDRFTGALTRVEEGHHAWFARPLIDSYHTVWFELHEELIGLAGLSRTEEAAAARAL